MDFLHWLNSPIVQNLKILFPIVFIVSAYLGYRQARWHYREQVLDADMGKIEKPRKTSSIWFGFGKWWPWYFCVIGICVCTIAGIVQFLSR